jgi:hypothetical protein
MGHYLQDPRRRRPLGQRVGVAAAGLSSLVILALLAAIVLDDEIADVHQVLPLPPALQRLTRSDDLAYPVHAALGTALNWPGRWPSSAGVQWFKALAHARSNEEAARAAEGFAQAVRSDAGPGRATSLLCNLVGQGATPQQSAALFSVGEFCGATALISSATVLPNPITAGETMEITVTSTSPLPMTLSIAIMIEGPSHFGELHQVYANQDFGAGETKRYVIRLVPTRAAMVGRHYIWVGSAAPALRNLYAWSPAKTEFVVQSPHASGTGSPWSTSAPLVPGLRAPDKCDVCRDVD